MEDKTDIFIDAIVEMLDEAVEKGIIFETQAGRLRALYLRILKNIIKKQFNKYEK